MRRIVRVEDGQFSVVSESPFASDHQLREAIAAHPEVLPSEDFGLGPLVTLASELVVESGCIDLLACDSAGRIAIIEFKKSSDNPDVRKVVPVGARNFVVAGQAAFR